MRLNTPAMTNGSREDGNLKPLRVEAWIYKAANASALQVDSLKQSSWDTGILKANAGLVAITAHTARSWHICLPRAHYCLLIFCACSGCMCERFIPFYRWETFWLPSSVPETEKVIDVSSFSSNTVT